MISSINSLYYVVFSCCLKPIASPLSLAGESFAINLVVVVLYKPYVE